MKKFRYILPIFLVALCILGLSFPSVNANGVTRLAVEFGSASTHSTSIIKGNQFQVQISIRGLPPQPAGMDRFGFDVLWNPNFIQYIDAIPTQFTGWTVNFDDSQVSSGILDDVGGYGPSTSIDRVWLTITFRCLAPGTSEISFAEADFLETWSGFTLAFSEEIPGTVNQLGARSYIVGGILSPTNKILVLMPYFILIVLIIGFTTIYIARKFRT